MPSIWYNDPRYSRGGAPAPERGRQAEAQFHGEHVLAGRAPQPDEAGIRVPERSAYGEIHPYPAVRPFRHSAVRPLGVHPYEQQPGFGVEPSPGRTHGRLVSGREPDGIGPTSRRGAAPRDRERHPGKLEAHRAAFVGVAAEARADEWAPRAQRPRQQHQRAHRRPDRPGREFPPAHGAERRRRADPNLEGLNRAPRHLKKPPFERGDRDLGEGGPKPQPEAERELARGGERVPTQQRAQPGRFGDPREAQRRGGERRDAARADRVVVGIEAEQGEAPGAPVGREIGIARAGEPRFAVVAREQRNRGPESAERMGLP